MPPLHLFYSGKMKNYFSLKALKGHHRNFKISIVAELSPEIRSIPEKRHVCTPMLKMKNSKSHLKILPNSANIEKLIIVHVRFFFSAKFSLCTILIRYCAIFSGPNFSPVYFFCIILLFILNIFSELFQ